jgi:hypothetical protein
MLACGATKTSDIMDIMRVVLCIGILQRADGDPRPELVPFDLGTFDVCGLLKSRWAFQHVAWMASFMQMCLPCCTSAAAITASFLFRQ